MYTLQRNNNLFFNVIDEHHILRSNFLALQYLRDPNNKISITPQILNEMDTNPNAILGVIKKFIDDTTKLFFTDLYVECNIFRDDAFYLEVTFFDNNKNDGDIVSKIMCSMYSVYFKELDKFMMDLIVRNVDFNGKEIVYQSRFKNNSPTMCIFIVLENDIS